MADSLKKIDLLLKAEMHALHFQKHKLIKGVILSFLIYIFIVFGYMMMNVAGFLYLYQCVTGWMAALVVGGINFFLGLIMLLLMRFRRQSSQEKMALELRQITRQQICDDVQQMTDEIKSIEKSIRSIGGFIQTPAAIAGTFGVILALLAPWIKSKTRKKSKSKS